jgi:NAD(P)H-nitrite reductase large subunit
MRRDNMAEYVIIGNGVSAVGCIEGIRKIDKVSPITVVSEEKYPVYCRPLISYYLEGKTDLVKMNYRGENFYKDNGVSVLYGKKAVKIDKENKSVLLDDGSILPYSSLCVATGSSPFVPPFANLEKVSKKFSFMTLDDTLALEKAIDSESRVLIVGAGLIGLKCAEGICKRVKSITVCDLAERVLSSILDNECASVMQKKLEENGINFMLGDTVTEFGENKAIMKSGKTVEFDVLVLAVGVRANVSLVKDAGGQIGRGITVNEKMQTSLNDIYSAGDCTEGFDISLGANRVLAILPNAYMQGNCAGENMAGGNAKFDNAIPMNSIGFFGLHAITAGSYFGEKDGGEMYEEKDDEHIKRLFTKDGFLTGFILIGQVERAGIYTSLIRKKVPLDTVNFDILKKSPTLFAYSEKNRGKMLGGVV